jgi:hypothetical protein
MLNKYLIILHGPGRVWDRSRFFDSNLFVTDSDRVKKDNNIM